MHEGLLYDKLPGARVRCHVCPWRCLIQPGQLGVCRARRNTGGVLEALNYGEATAANIDPIEKKPLFHFYPGSLVFSLGTWGCNFHCLHCQNWEIAMATPERRADAQPLPPEAAVAMAQTFSCQGLAWTYNEPTIWFEYTLDSARLAKEAGLYTVYVTNGFITPEALDTIGPYLDCFRVDVKGFTDAFYRKLTKVSQWRECLAAAARAKTRWNMHLEVVTNIIPTMNDDEAQLKGIAAWIRDSLGDDTPWHLTRFYPNYQFGHLPPTPLPTLERAYALGREAGLRFVYLGNVPGHASESTVCYRCGETAVARQGYASRIVGLKDGSCAKCGSDLNFRTAASPPRRWREAAARPEGGRTP
ncbi:MAG: AmmeMemoRadiSam system radical SAM enzyme [Chloroflexi bacterium]|nr:AmmeMemoRadiSam system radical SAM enzyme [Chloroflexota bacterium]